MVFCIANYPKTIYCFTSMVIVCILIYVIGVDPLHTSKYNYRIVEEIDKNKGEEFWVESHITYCMEIRKS